MRLLNKSALITRGNIKGRKNMLEILEAGLDAADPYFNMQKLFRRNGNLLYVGNRDFEATGDPQTGDAVYDLNEIENIYVVGAGKGIQRAALALEEILAGRLSGGELICKYGDETLCRRIHITAGSHPLPDENCVSGCERIAALAPRVTGNDLVITMIANGGSSLLTMPVSGVPLVDIQEMVRLMQITKGAKTKDLNTVRNHIDQMKGGRISRLFAKARQIHIAVADINNSELQPFPRDYNFLVRYNNWLYNLPDGTTFGDAVAALKAYDAWEKCPQSIRQYILEADPAKETVKYDEFKNMKFRIFGIMPASAHFLIAAKAKAGQLGYKAVSLSEGIDCEAAQMGYIAGKIGRNIEQSGEPLQAPVAIFSTGEMRVTVDRRKGIGGRNQEYALSAAIALRGCEKTVIASVDTDGTDGPGGLELEGAPDCLSGGIVDGQSADDIEKLGFNIRQALADHDVSRVLWPAGCGIYSTQGISLNDLTVILVDR